MSEWISVKDRLPKPEKEVLVVVEHIGYRIVTSAIYEDGTIILEDSKCCWDDIDFIYGIDSIYDEDNDVYLVPEGWWEYSHYGEYVSHIDGIITHWMPLPEPPK